jgi:hypothetical protein
MDLLRSLETNGEKYKRSDVLPSGSLMKTKARLVEEYGEEKVNLIHGNISNGGKNGEFVQFDVDQLLVLVIKAFGLTEVAKTRAVRINLSIDGAQLSKRMSHLTMGFTVSDPAAICPFTGRPLGMNNDTKLMQTRNVCFPVKILMHKETKQIYDEFQDVFNRVHSLSDKFEGETRPTSPLWDEGFKPLSVGLNMDLSAVWKMFKVGGAAKVQTLFCHCCSVNSNVIHVPNVDPCTKYCQSLHDCSDGSTWRCYHKEFLSKETVDEFSEQLDDMKVSLGPLVDKFDTFSTVIGKREDPHKPLGNSKRDISSIHFDVEEPQNEEKVYQYDDQLEADLTGRCINFDDDATTKQKQELLRASLIQEWTFRKLTTDVSHGKSINGNCAYYVLDSAPCVLHAENRMGLKILELLLNEGLNKCENFPHYKEQWPAEKADKKRREAFVEDVTDYINTQCLGTVDDPAQWQCPVDKDCKKVETICLDNNRTRLIISNLTGLIDISVKDESRREKWEQSIVQDYCAAMVMARRKEDFAPQDVLDFQLRVDLFFQTWVELHGRDGITNYIHMLASGHFAEYLSYWGSLYAHSQQGTYYYIFIIKREHNVLPTTNSRFHRVGAFKQPN